LAAILFARWYPRSGKKIARWYPRSGKKIARWAVPTPRVAHIVGRGLGCRGRAPRVRQPRRRSDIAVHIGTFDQASTLVGGCLRGVIRMIFNMLRQFAGRVERLSREFVRNSSSLGQARSRTERSGVVSWRATGSCVVKRLCSGSELRTAQSEEAHSNTHHDSDDSDALPRALST
jgi:hypothetical protein